MFSFLFWNTPCSLVLLVLHRRMRFPSVTVPVFALNDPFQHRNQRREERQWDIFRMHLLYWKYILAGLIGGTAIGYSWDSIRATKWYYWMADSAMPLVRKLDCEKAHRAGVLLEKYHLGIVI